MEEQEAVRWSFGGRSGWHAESRPESRFFMKASSSGEFGIAWGMTNLKNVKFQNTVSFEFDN
jgi:hypothetical protein